MYTEAVIATSPVAVVVWMPTPLDAVAGVVNSEPGFATQRKVAR
jgi:hypothetical protein